MDRLKFEIAKQIENRINYLKFTKQFMQSCFENSTFGVRIEASIFKFNSSTPISFSDKNFENNLTLVDPEDTEFIIKSIDERIKELETQFEKI